ncbi:MAG TPA: hypothetical protein VFR47_27840, partial [Anaerolineales bacterium]|nr:hypothetical protein [Anaerolineales bacterium]
MRICQEDPIITFIRDMFDANPLRIPDKRISPLSLIAGVGKKVRYLGSVKNYFPDLSIIKQTMPDLEVNKTNEAKGAIGIDLLSGIIAALSNFSIQGTELATKIEENNSFAIRFFFPNLERHYVIPIHIAQQIARKQPKLSELKVIDRSSNPNFYIVDSIFACNQIGVEITQGAGLSANFTATLADVGLKSEITGSKGNHVVIQGKTRLAFAFSAIRVTVDESKLIGI